MVGGTTKLMSRLFYGRYETSVNSAILRADLGYEMEEIVN